MTPPVYEKVIAALREEFVDVCKSVFGERLVAIIAKGSTVRGGFIPGLSDIDFHVYLKNDAFIYSDFLKVESGLSLQEKMDKLIQKYDVGGGPIQVNLLNVSQPPDWSGPLPGTYILLYGDDCPYPPHTAEKMLKQDLDNLKNPIAYKWIHTYADKSNDQLPNFVRLLNTQVTPTLYRVLSLLTQDAIRVWKMTKFEVIEALEKLDDTSAKWLAQLGRDFYKIARQRDRQRKDPQFCRTVIRLGFKVVDLGREIGNELDT